MSTTLHIKGDRISLNGADFNYSSLFTREFYAYSDSVAEKYKSDLYVVNELFLNFIQKYLALEYFINNNDISLIEVSDNPQLQLYAADIARKKHIRFNGNSLGKIKFVLVYPFVVFASFIYLSYLMLRIPHKRDDIDAGRDTAVLRTKSAINKIPRFGFKFEIENPHLSDSIYRLFPKSVRFGWVVRSFFQSFSFIRKIKKQLSQFLGEDSSYWVFPFYQKRIVHVLMYEKLFEAYIKCQSGNTVYTANNLDRFSVIEEVMAKKYNKRLVCIPHGIEYGFKMPKGFSSDLFYTNSQYAADYLNKLYETKKFAFDYDVAEKMLKVAHQKSFSNRRLVFFTEPREPEVNFFIIESLTSLLASKGIQLYIKHHPGDNKSDYKRYKLPEITDLGDAICDNVCISRKSTTLLEGVYNGSVSAAIILNAKDESVFYTFPSLQSESITVTTSIEELFGWICKQFEK